jgi:hypothetical protein
MTNEDTALQSVEADRSHPGGFAHRLWRKLPHRAKNIFSVQIRIVYEYDGGVDR